MTFEELEAERAKLKRDLARFRRMQITDRAIILAGLVLVLLARWHRG